MALIGIIVENSESTAQLNALLHDAGQYIIGRMGLPYRAKGVNIISVAMDAPGDVISALSGKLGRLEGVTAKTVYARRGAYERKKNHELEEKTVGAGPVSGPDPVPDCLRPEGRRIGRSRRNLPKRKNRRSKRRMVQRQTLPISELPH